MHKMMLSGLYQPNLPNKTKPNSMEQRPAWSVQVNTVVSRLICQHQAHLTQLYSISFITGYDFLKYLLPSTTRFSNTRVQTHLPRLHWVLVQFTCQEVSDYGTATVFTLHTISPNPSWFHCIDHFNPLAIKYDRKLNSIFPYKNFFCLKQFLGLSSIC